MLQSFKINVYVKRFDEFPFIVTPAKSLGEPEGDREKQVENP